MPEIAQISRLQAIFLFCTGNRQIMVKYTYVISPDSKKGEYSFEKVWHFDSTFT